VKPATPEKARKLIIWSSYMSWTENKHFLPRANVLMVLLPFLWITACTADTQKSATQPESVSSVWSVNLLVTGGFAGINRQLTLDSTGRMTIKNRRKNQSWTVQASDKLVQEVGELSKTTAEQDVEFSSQRPGSDCYDCFNYQLTIKFDSTSKSLDFGGFPQKDSVKWQLVQLLQPHLNQGAIREK
jgi:hypothetical protein